MFKFAETQHNADDAVVTTVLNLFSFELAGDPMTAACLLCLVGVSAAMGFRVLSSGRDAAAHLPNYSGAELLNSSFVGLGQTTVCARFLTYQFIYQGYGKDTIHWQLDLGGKGLLRSWIMTEAEKRSNIHTRLRQGVWVNGGVAHYDSNGFRVVSR